MESRYCLGDVFIIVNQKRSETGDSITSVSLIMSDGIINFDLESVISALLIAHQAQSKDNSQKRQFPSIVFKKSGLEQSINLGWGLEEFKRYQINYRPLANVVNTYGYASQIPSLNLFGKGHYLQELLAFQKFCQPFIDSKTNLDVSLVQPDGHQMLVSVYSVRDLLNQYVYTELSSKNDIRSGNFPRNDVGRKLIFCRKVQPKSSSLCPDTKPQPSNLSAETGIAKVEQDSSNNEGNLIGFIFFLVLLHLFIF